MLFPKRAGEKIQSAPPVDHLVSHPKVISPEEHFKVAVHEASNFVLSVQAHLVEQLVAEEHVPYVWKLTEVDLAELLMQPVYKIK